MNVTDLIIDLLREMDELDLAERIEPKLRRNESGSKTVKYATSEGTREVNDVEDYGTTVVLN